VDAASEVKNRLSIEDVIGEYVQLKRSGHNFKGLSPFTNEKTPSFMVSPDKQIWHDFSSGKGGNMFSFVMEMEGVDFKGALELLARRAGVDLEQYRNRHGYFKGPDKERLISLNEDAARFYQAQLVANRAAWTYVYSERGFSKNTIAAFKLGYSPNTDTALRDYLKKRGYSEAEIRTAGLSTNHYRGPRDMFRGRIMIPLMDPQGRVIGFTARLLRADDRGPKYINTPQTVLYDKSRHIYGLHLAKQAIRENKFVVIAEGNLDVIMSHQAGVRQTVATAGTALTEAHLKTLSRFTTDIRLCFDSDKAGIAATERAVVLASQKHVSLNIIEISDGKDPDELIKKSPSLWEQAIHNYTYAIDWLIATVASRYDLSSAAGKREFSDMLLPTISRLDDPVEQDHFLNLIANRLQVSRTSLDEKLHKTVPEERPVSRQRIKTEVKPLDGEQVEIIKGEDHLLCLMLKRRTLRSQLANLEPDMLSRVSAAELLRNLKQAPLATASELLKQAEDQEYVKILLLEYEELYQGLEPSELKYEAARLQTRLIENYVKRKKSDIAKQLRLADETTGRTLLEKVRKLDELLRINLEENINAQENSG
jgi:DNA primase